MKRVVLTGATGGLGVALIKNLISHGIETLALVRKNSAHAVNIPKHPLVTVRECGLDELGTIENDGEQCDVFYHFGWDGTYGPDRNDYYRQCNNIRYTLDAVAAANRLGCKKFVGAGSQAEYGRVEGALTPATPVFPENGYGMAKLAAGLMGCEYAHSLNMAFNWVRIASVYGPIGNNIVDGSLKKLLAGERAEFTACEQKWDFLYCDDAAEAFRLVGERGKDGSVYVLGSGESKPLREYVYELAEVAGARDKIDMGVLPYADRQVMFLKADISALTADTGWTPSTKFKEGVEQVKRSIISEKIRGGGTNRLTSKVRFAFSRGLYGGAYAA